MNSTTCIFCNQSFKSTKSLINHVKREHTIDMKEYYDLVKLPNDGFCKICGKETQFLSYKQGYRQYCSRQCRHNDKELVQKTLQKSFSTCLERYGVSNGFKTEKCIKNSHSQEAQEKQRMTCKEKYGVEYGYLTKEGIQNAHSKEANEKRKNTCLERYGVDNPFKLASVQKNKNSDEAKQNRRNTTFKNFGVYSIFQLPEVKIKSNIASHSSEIIEKRKQTMFDRYGVYGSFGLDKVKCINWSQEICLKRNATRKKNNSYKSSKQEDFIYTKLLKKYNLVKRQYYSNIYPYCCDFYIPEKDLYIECNFHWTHGGHLFNENNLEDINKLSAWEEKAKTSNYYKTAINVWTIRDVKKYNCAKENKLNYLCFYNMAEFDIWLENGGK